MPISYEVSATVRADLCDAFEKFMVDVHIPDVMATGAFLSSTFSNIEAGRYRASYLCQDRDTLNSYLAEHSPRLREDVAKRFPDGIEFSREIWTVLASL